MVSSTEAQYTQIKYLNGSTRETQFVAASRIVALCSGGDQKWAPGDVIIDWY